MIIKFEIGNSMNILLIGSGGRESAISKFLSKNKNCNLYSIMSYHNPDIVNNSKEYLIESEENINEIIKYSNKNKIELAFLGSEVSINAGIADALKKNNINVIGPVQCCAKIETDKGWARNFISKYIPLCNPKYKIFDFKNPNSIKEAYKYIEKLDSFVIKPTGLTCGKGV